MGGIYAIYNVLNGKRYIGSTKDFRGRMNEHFSLLRRGINPCGLLQKAYNKYGKDAFAFVVLEPDVPDESLLNREQWWFDNTPCQYNICKVAGRSTGVPCSEHRREQARESAKEKLKNPEWREFHRKTLPRGDEHWLKKRGLGRTEEERVKMSASWKKKFKEGYKHPNTRPIVQLNREGSFIAEYESASQAAKVNSNFNRSSIKNCLAGQRPTMYNFIWKYKDEYETSPL